MGVVASVGGIEVVHALAVHHSTACRLWTNSTVPEYQGWMWKADTSSDELVGHLLCFTVRRSAHDAGLCNWCCQ